MIFLSCISLQLFAPRKYDIGFLNKTGFDLHEVMLVSNGKEWGKSTLVVAGGEATQGWLTDPIPPEVELKMTDGRGESKTAMLNLKDIPKFFCDGTIYFAINRDGSVQVKALKNNDLEGYKELIKGLRPEGEYHFAFVNKTGRDLQEVSVYYGARKVGTGNYIPARAQANFSYSDPLNEPCAMEAELRWIEDGAPRATKVSLEAVPRKLEGFLFFIIKADGFVEVHPVDKGDDKASLDLIK